MPRMTYVQALNGALHDAMERDSRVFVIGQGVQNPWYVGQSMVGLHARFGDARVIDPPVSEQGMTGFGIGAALAGLRPVVLHPRLDFMLMGIEQLINQAANWSYMFAGQQSVPLTIWGIINRGGQQGAQHSQAIQAMLAHVPGLKVVAPGTPQDARTLMLAAIEDPNPVVVIDERWLYAEEADVDTASSSGSAPGSAEVAAPGHDLTIVASSYMLKLALAARAELAAQDVDVEVINLRTIKPWDTETVLASVRRTGRLVVADGGWRSFGVSAEIAATVAEHAFDALRAPIARLALPDVPAPASRTLEAAYYPTVADVVRAAHAVVSGTRGGAVAGSVEV